MKKLGCIALLVVILALVLVQEVRSPPIVARAVERSEFDAVPSITRTAPAVVQGASLTTIGPVPSLDEVPPMPLESVAPSLPDDQRSLIAPP